MKLKTLVVLATTFLATAALAASAPERTAQELKAREIYARVVSIPTQLGNGLVPQMADYLAGEFRAAGFPAEDIRIVPFKGEGDATASLVVRYRGNGKSGKKPILLMAHMDVVTAKRADWERDPYQFIEDNGYFYGRGTYDDKQGVVAITSTFLRMKAEKFVPNRDLIAFFSGDEETAQATSVDIVKNHRALIDAEFALNGDAGGGVLDDATGKPLYFSLQTAEKTYVDFSVTAHNPGGHSSQPRDDNAIYELAAALTRLHDFKFPVMWNDTTLAQLKKAGELASGELGAALGKFAADPHDAAAAEIISHNPTYVGTTRTTCVATMLSGGHAQNALPQSASANVNCRIFPGVKIEDVRQTLQQVAGGAVEVRITGAPMSSDASPLRPDVVKAVTRAVEAIRPGVPVVPAQISGATDGLVFRAGGIPTYGVDGNFMKGNEDFSHGLNERLSVRSFYDSLTFWYVMVTGLAGKPAK
ncbi:MAG TPA: M20/M25/M40 family metallo-hydrolase [Steroidobacteraceae bacterium]|nr:M20/M25/M40 family metallo-hydrolase [Steroidobacteraceae bacterium]